MDAIDAVSKNYQSRAFAHVASEIELHTLRTSYSGCIFVKTGDRAINVMVESSRSQPPALALRHGYCVQHEEHQ